MRTQLGESTRLWAGSGLHVWPGRWSAFSGARSVDYNVACVHAASGGENIERALAKVTEAGVPAVIMIAGEALGEVQVLVRADWVCIGSNPLLLCEELPTALEDGVARLDGKALTEARTLVGEAYDLPEALTVVALPDTSVSEVGQSVWGLREQGELVSCMALVDVDETAVVWSMATPPRLQRRGFGRRLLQGALAASAREGGARCLLYSSPQGIGLYTSMGFRLVERWQVWSRPRWVLSRV